MTVVGRLCSLKCFESCVVYIGFGYESCLIGLILAKFGGEIAGLPNIS